jgi:hypothetical protein
MAAGSSYIIVATLFYGGQLAGAYVTSVLALQRSGLARDIGIQFDVRSGEALITRALIWSTSSSFPKPRICATRFRPGPVCRYGVSHAPASGVAPVRGASELRYKLAQREEDLLKDGSYRYALFETMIDPENGLYLSDMHSAGAGKNCAARSGSTSGASSPTMGRSRSRVAWKTGSPRSSKSRLQSRNPCAVRAFPHGKRRLVEQERGVRRHEGNRAVQLSPRERFQLAAPAARAMRELGPER